MNTVTFVKTGSLLFSYLLMSVFSAVSYDKVGSYTFVGSLFSCFLFFNLSSVLWLAVYSLTFCNELINSTFCKHLHFLRKMLGSFLNIRKQSAAADCSQLTGFADAADG